MIDGAWMGWTVLSLFFSCLLCFFSLACNDTVTQTSKHLTLIRHRDKRQPHEAPDFGGKMRLRVRRVGCRRGCVMPPREGQADKVSPCHQVSDLHAEWQRAGREGGTGPSGHSASTPGCISYSTVPAESHSDRPAADSPRIRNTENTLKRAENNNQGCNHNGRPRIRGLTGPNGPQRIAGSGCAASNQASTVQAAPRALLPLVGVSFRLSVPWFLLRTVNPQTHNLGAKVYEEALDASGHVKEESG